MGQLKGFANVVFPALDLGAGVSAWTAMLDQEPAFVGDDFAVFGGDGIEVGLTAKPWVDHPLVLLESRRRRGRSPRARRPGRDPAR